MIELAQVKPITLEALILSEFPPNPVWIEGVLPKSAKLLFGGEAKIGKSFMALNLARSLAMGIPLFGIEEFVVPVKARTLIVEQEIGPVSMQERCRRIFHDDPSELREKNVFIASKVGPFRLDDPHSVKWLISVCKDYGINVCFLDPIGKMHFYDENDNASINRLFHSLDGIIHECRDNGLSLVISHHFSKPFRDPSIKTDRLDPYNFRGASKFKDDPDTLVTAVVGQRHYAPYRWWTVRTRWITRHGPEPPEFTLAVNRHDDLRVTLEQRHFAAGAVQRQSNPKINGFDSL